MVLLLLTCCLLLLPLCESVIVLCFVVRSFMSILVLQSSWWAKERAGCFALFVFLVSRDFGVALPHGAMGLFAFCDCGISWSYSLTNFPTYLSVLEIIPSFTLTYYFYVQPDKPPWYHCYLHYILYYQCSYSTVSIIIIVFIRLYLINKVWQLSHIGSAKARASLCNWTVLPWPSLYAYTKYRCWQWLRSRFILFQSD